MGQEIVTRNLTLAECARAGDVVVVIDVLRAFSAEAVAFERGVTEIVPVGTVEEALAWKARDPRVLVMGEMKGYRVPGFDLWNSPAELLRTDLTGRRLVHRSTSGIQGLLCKKYARILLVASFLVAGATARFLLREGVRQVDFLITGQRDEHDGEEDTACADTISDLLNGRVPDPARAKARVRASYAGQRFLREDPAEGWLEDLELCLQIDRCDFAMRVFPGPEGLVIRKVNPNL